MLKIKLGQNISKFSFNFTSPLGRYGIEALINQLNKLFILVLKYDSNNHCNYNWILRGHDGDEHNTHKMI
jgi:hypothetical protein